MYAGTHSLDDRSHSSVVTCLPKYVSYSPRRRLPHPKFSGSLHPSLTFGTCPMFGERHALQASNSEDGPSSPSVEVPTRLIWKQTSGWCIVVCSLRGMCHATFGPQGTRWCLVRKAHKTAELTGITEAFQFLIPLGSVPRKSRMCIVFDSQLPLTCAWALRKHEPMFSDVRS